MSEDFDAALEIALKRLRAKDRFEAEIRRLLIGYEESVISSVIAYLKEKKILNDVHTAESFVRTRSGYGKNRIEAELATRGAGAAVLAQTLPDGQSDRERATALLAKRFPGSGDRARAGRLLFSRGFDPDDIESILNGYFGEDN